MLQKRGIDFVKKGKEISFHIQNKKKVIYPIIEELIKKKILFDDIHLEKPTLEEYFIAQSRT